MVLFIFILVLFCAISGTSQTSQTRKFIVSDDQPCEALNDTGHGYTAYTTTSRSLLECARGCAESGFCSEFRSAFDLNGKRFCQYLVPTISRTQHSTAWQASAPIWECYHRLNVGENIGIHHLSQVDSTENSTFPPWTDDSKLVNSKWVVFIDNKVPSTLTRDHLLSRTSIEESKVTYHNPSNGVRFVNVVSGHDCTSNLFKGNRVYVMATSKGLSKDSDRNFKMFTWNGNVYRNLIPLQGQQRITQWTFDSLRVLVQDPGEYTIRLEPSQENVDKLIAYLDKGYKVFNFRYAKINHDGNRSTVSLFKINEQIRYSSEGPYEPLQFVQILQLFPDAKQTFTVLPRIPGSHGTFSAMAPDPILLSPLWRSALDTRFHTRIQQINRLTKLLTQGHRFRVAFKGGFYDVDSVVKLGDKMYFLLPQQAETPYSLYFNNETFGVRAAVSFGSDVYSWCAHLLESETVIDTRSDIVSNVKYFVDKKETIAIISHFTNGTIVFGSVKDVADTAYTGKDINILVEWLNEDKKQLFLTCAISIFNYNKSDLYIKATTRFSWHLTSISNGDLKISETCDMEMGFVSTKHSVELLVYNAKSGLPVIQLSEVKVTWFAQ